MKQFTLSDLKNIELSTAYKTAHPPEDMTNEIWQECFNRIAPLVEPSKEHWLNTVNTPVAKDSKIDNYKITPEYRQFINSVLYSIRQGECDHCFYIYQIVDLLKFEPKLKTTWISEYQCFEVWLELSHW